MERIHHRTIWFFAGLMLCLLVSVLSIFTLANGTTLAQTAAQQSSYKVSVTKTRGTIYDQKIRPLTGTQTEYRAAISPTIEATAALTHAFSQKEMQKIYPTLTAGKPFTLSLPKKIEGKDITVLGLRKRYSTTQSAAHTIGYLDGSGHGVSGIEKAFDEQLSKNPGKISVSYKVDALNRTLAGESPKVEDTSGLQNAGVVLTLDKDIQQIAENAAKKYLKRGAVVVSEVPSGQIRAMVSLPNFDPDHVADVLDDDSAPLLNRAVSAYSVGSVFKLASASTALQYGIPASTRYTCTGSILVDGAEFHCYNGESHGDEDMKQAIAKSCNTYFVNLMQKVPQSQFLLMAQHLGFGQKMELAPGYSSAAGTLPTLKILRIPRALANFSFGQGDLTATPVQIAGMVNAIASGGYYTQPYLYKGMVDENLSYTERAPAQKSIPVMSEQTAAFLRSAMAESVETGTSRKFKPKSGGAGAKTATAQTGRFKNGVEEVESWVAGFYPLENPKYVITVLGEGGTGGGVTCGPVFKEIADYIPLS